MSVPPPAPALSATFVADIERAGYYPALVVDVVSAAVGEEEVVNHLVQSETTFDHDAVRRHITVLALTTTRLVIAHADDRHDEGTAGEIVTATSESIPLDAIRGVMLTHVVEDASGYRAGTLGREITLTVGWGTVSRVDMVPASCADPACEADHGYEGTVTADDLVMRISAAAEGVAALRQAISFARDLTSAVGRR
ncbi:MAG: phosphodiesterase [Tetrasphaera sp.]|jgi:hypothetical protein|nr:phosphodiesterase [Tetrasphaera sp.]